MKNNTTIGDLKVFVESDSIRSITLGNSIEIKRLNHYPIPMFNVFYKQKLSNTEIEVTVEPIRVTTAQELKKVLDAIDEYNDRLTELDSEIHKTQNKLWTLSDKMYQQSKAKLREHEADSDDS